MKIWLFAVVESIVAALGLVAYFWAGNFFFTTVAVITAAALAIAQPLIAAHRQRKLEAYQDRQYQNSIDSVDKQLQSLLDQTIDPQLPHRASIAAVLQRRRHDGDELLRQYDHLVKSIADREADAHVLAARFGDQTTGWSVGDYLMGLAALALGDIPTAHKHFCRAREKQPCWIEPWHAWAKTAFELELWDEIREQHPHVNGVELLPYDAGDERSFIELNEQQREGLSSQFQQTASSLGNYYAIAEFYRSRHQIAESRDEFKKVA